MPLGITQWVSPTLKTKLKTLIVHTVHVKKSDGIAHLKIEYKQTKIKQSINELQIKIIIIHFH